MPWGAGAGESVVHSMESTPGRSSKSRIFLGAIFFNSPQGKLTLENGSLPQQYVPGRLPGIETDSATPRYLKPQH